MRIREFLLFVVTTSLLGCVSDVDFDQADDIEINNSHLISLVYFEAEANNFLDELDNENLFISDTTELPIFNTSLNENYLVQVDFHFEISNFSKRRVSIDFIVLDKNDSNTFNFSQMDVNSNTINYNNEQNVLELDIPSVILTQKIVINVLLDSGSIPLDPNDNMIINFKSSAEFHYRIIADVE